MLQKRRDLGSMPDGLGVTASKITKGRAVVRKFVDGIYTYALPSSTEEAADVYGFITLRIDDDLYTDKYFDVIPKGVKAVVYTLAKDNEWATSEFVGDLVKGDKCTVESTGDDAGKIRKITGSETALFEVMSTSDAMVGYEDALVTVKVL